MIKEGIPHPRRLDIGRYFQQCYHTESWTPLVQFLTPSKRKEIMSSWYDEAACKGMDPELFFPQTKGIVSHFKDLRRRCENCTVRDECEDQVISELVFCVNIREHKVGFRAGMSEKRLKNIAISIRKDRAKERAA